MSISTIAWHFVNAWIKIVLIQIMACYQSSALQAEYKRFLSATHLIPYMVQSVVCRPLTTKNQLKYKNTTSISVLVSDKTATCRNHLLLEPFPYRQKWLFDVKIS